MEHTHPNVTQRKGEKLSGEEITHDNPPAETTALSNTSQPLGISQAQLEALTNSIGQMMSFQINNTLSAFESKFMAEIEQVKLGRSRSSSEASQAEDNDERNEDGDVLSEDSKEEVDEGEDNNDEEDPGSVEGSEPPSSNEQGGAPNTQQRTSGGGGDGDDSCIELFALTFTSAF